MAITIDLGMIILVVLVIVIVFGIYYMVKKKRAASSDIYSGTGRYNDMNESKKARVDTMDDIISKLRADIRNTHKQNVELFKSFDYFLGLLQKQRKQNDGLSRY